MVRGGGCAASAALLLFASVAQGCTQAQKDDCKLDANAPEDQFCSVVGGQPICYCLDGGAWFRHARRAVCYGLRASKVTNECTECPKKATSTSTQSDQRIIGGVIGTFPIYGLSDCLVECNKWTDCYAVSFIASSDIDFGNCAAGPNACCTFHDQTGLFIASPGWTVHWKDVSYHNCNPVDPTVGVGTACGGAGQQCFDPDEKELEDWKCSCAAPHVGQGVLAPAVCAPVDSDHAVDECKECGVRFDVDTATKYYTGAEVACGLDVVLADCRSACETFGACKAYTHIDMAGANHITIYESCVEGVSCCILAGSGDVSISTNDAKATSGKQSAAACEACTAAGQNCNDPTPNTATVGDWACECVPPMMGPPVTAGTAMCDTPIPPTPAPPTPSPPTPAPPTPSPPTPIPPTPAPPTPAPPTSAPPTPAPPTPSPPTPIPPTPAPPTPAPPTPAPLTPSPPTAVPPTPASPTISPPTPAPPTLSPPTLIPPTPAPPTPAPLTPSPPTLIPPTPAPPTPAPPTQTPPTAVPATPAPPTPAPPTPSPPTPIPRTPAPPTPAPSTPIPQTPIPPTPPPTPILPTPAPPTPVPQTPTPPMRSPATVVPLTPIPQIPIPVSPIPPTPAPPTATPSTPQPATPRPPSAAGRTPAPGTGQPPPWIIAPPTTSPLLPVPATAAPPSPTALVPDAPRLPVSPVSATLPPSWTGRPPRPSDLPMHSIAPGGPPLPDATTPPTALPEHSRVGTPAPDASSAPQEDVAAPPSFVEAQEAADRVATASTASAVAASVAAGAGPAMRLAAVAVPCRPLAGEGGRSEEDAAARYPFMMAPLQLTLLGSRAFGAVAGNIALSVGITVLGYAVSLAAGPVGRLFAASFFNELDAQGLTKFPSAPLMVFQLLYQGTTLAAMDLVLDPPRWELCLVGVAGVAFTFAVPFVVLKAVASGVPRHAFLKADPETTQWWQHFLLGKGEWVSRRARLHWIDRWSSMVRAHAGHASWFAIVEYAASFAISAANSAKVESWAGCGHVKMACAAVSLVLVVVEVTLWPHAHFRNSMFDVMMLGGQCVAMILLAVGYYSADLTHSNFSLGATMLMYCVVVLMVRVALDLLALLWVLVRGRRRRLQKEQFALEAAGREASDPAAGSEMPVILLESDGEGADGLYDRHVRVQTPETRKTLSSFSPAGAPSPHRSPVSPSRGRGSAGARFGRDRHRSPLRSLARHAAPASPFRASRSDLMLRTVSDFDPDDTLLMSESFANQSFAQRKEQGPTIPNLAQKRMTLRDMSDAADRSNFYLAQPATPLRLSASQLTTYEI
eukprot:TRINITY_DN4510_c0_g1_i10.p1 TRINITY_DN4510_c0_g1~~TRINITY_DN4510_c0_g1_i10.p1  ORF type:complete len:1304 (+),score=169.09 TRINITY_DN4510_c0_g1_i10:31-3942(+)